MTRFVLLGGGHAHLQVSCALAQEPLRPAQFTRVTSIQRPVDSGMGPGLAAADDCKIALSALAARAGIGFAEAAAVASPPPGRAAATGVREAIA